MSKPITKAAKAKHIDLLDYVRALAILHIVIYHYFLEQFHGSFLIVPEGIAANISRLEIFKDGGILGFIKNVFSFLFVYGFTSVNLFLVLSGFVLSYSLLKSLASGEKIKWVSYVFKRFKRILAPFYLSVLIGIGIWFLRNISLPQFADAPLYNIFDVLKMAFVPLLFFDIQFLQKFSGDYWFIPLILQLYLLFPILFFLLKKYRPLKFLAAIFFVTVCYRFIATYFLDSVPMGVLYPAQNGYLLFSFFLPRLFEFAFGMALAFWHYKNPILIEKMTGFRYLIAGFFLTLLGLCANAYRFGWAFSDLLVGVGLFYVFLCLGSFLAKQKVLQRIMQKCSEAAYEIFLLHHYFLNYLFLPLMVTIHWTTEISFWLMAPVFVILSVLIGRGQYLLSLAVEKGLRKRES